MIVICDYDNLKHFWDKLSGKLREMLRFFYFEIKIVINFIIFTKSLRMFLAEK